MKNLYVQIPLLDDGQCLGIINEVNAFEDIVGGCVVDDSAEERENHMIDSIRKTKESYLLEQPGDYRSNPMLDWSWLQDKLRSVIRLATPKFMHKFKIADNLRKSRFLFCKSIVIFSDSNCS